MTHTQLVVCVHYLLLGCRGVCLDDMPRLESCIHWESVQSAGEQNKTNLIVWCDLINQIYVILTVLLTIWDPQLYQSMSVADCWVIYWVKIGDHKTTVDMCVDVDNQRFVLVRYITLIAYLI